MAYNISDTLKSLNDQIAKEMMIILKIEGSQYLYGSAPILETARWDDPRIKWDNEQGITWDGEIEKDNSKPYIMPIKSKTTKQITQQLLVDKGGSGSVATMNIELVDYRGEVARDLSFDQIGEPLGKKATVYMGLKGGRYPQDFLPLMRGYIDDLKYNAGSISVSVALATNLLRQSAFEQYQTQITANIDSLTTTIPVVSTEPIFQTQDSFTAYIKIDDEIMEIVSVDEGAGELEVIRSRLGTLPAAHDQEADTTSYYTLEGHPIDLALKLLFSKADNAFYETDFEINALNRISSTETIDGAIITNDYNIEDSSGLVIGDFVEISGSASNDGEYPIIGFGVLDTGKSYILVATGSLTEETGLSLKLKVKSKYNVLPDGLGMDVDFVDTAAFEATKSLYSADFIDMTFKLKDTIEDCREFIIKEIMKPSSLYLIPRKGKTSCKKTAAPFSINPIPTLNTTNIYDITKIEMRRSTHKYLLNQIIFRYNEGVLEDKFFDKFIRSNADSFTRIKVGRKRQVIEAKGYLRSSESLQVVDRVATSILSRYKFGARYVRNVKVLLSVGLQLEIGDIVFFGGEDTKLVNLQTGDRDLPPAQYEIINKKLDISKGETILELLESGFSIEGIVGTYSASSSILAGSTAERLLIGELWDSDQYSEERDKWDRWVGLKVRVRSDDYTFDETTTLSGFDASTNNGLILDPPLSSAPAAGYIVELAKYEEYGTTEDEETLKLTHTFTMPQAEISAVTDLKTFEVLDTTDFEVGMEINVHSDDYTIDSEIRIIDDITGNTIILDEDLNISPDIGHFLEVYKYAEAKGYRIL